MFFHTTLFVPKDSGEIQANNFRDNFYIISLGKLPMITSTDISYFLNHKDKIILCEVSRRAMHVLSLMGIDTQLTISDSVEEAVGKVMKQKF